METIKDLAPIIIGIVALWLSYYSISAQIRKTHRVQWIQDFRKEIALFNYLVVTFHYDEIAADDLQKNVNLIQMYLDDNNELHMELSDLMDEMICKLPEIRTRIKLVVQMC